MATKSEKDFIQTVESLVREGRRLGGGDRDRGLKLYTLDPRFPDPHEVVMELRPHYRPDGNSLELVDVTTLEYEVHERELHYESSVQIEFPLPDDQRLGTSEPTVSSYDKPIDREVDPSSDRHRNRIKYMQQVAMSGVPIGQIEANLWSDERLNTRVCARHQLKPHLEKIFSAEQNAAATLQTLMERFPILGESVIEEIAGRQVFPLVRAGAKAENLTVLNRHAAMLRDALGPDKFSDLIKNPPPKEERRESGKRCESCGAMLLSDTSEKVPSRKKRRGAVAIYQARLITM